MCGPFTPFSGPETSKFGFAALVKGVTSLTKCAETGVAATQAMGPRKGLTLERAPGPRL